jgi:hypothetical protein
MCDIGVRWSGRDGKNFVDTLSDQKMIAGVLSTVLIAGRGHIETT